MDIINEAFEELTTLNTITETKKTDEGCMCTIDARKLFRIGYILTFDMVRPIFTNISDLQYISDLYADDVVPKKVFFPTNL
jgi:hypothetical protein